MHLIVEIAAIYSVWHLVVQIFCEIDLQNLFSDFENPNFRTG